MNFNEIYRLYAPKIFRLCSGYFNDSDMAKDLTQETFIAVWEGLDQFRNESQIGTWIYRIATNKCLRKAATDKKLPKANLPAQLESEEFDDEKEILHQQLQQFISELPEIDRIVISLYFEEVPQEKIAEITGLSHANVRVKFHRIKEKLTEKFKKNGQL